MSLKSKLIHGLMLLKNHRINRHIVVFESDDWGSVRMPSLEALSRFKAKGFRIGVYNNVDTLASNQDLENLIEVLASVKDKNGNPAKITLNTCVANPDFEKIKENDFTEYFYEPFTETLKRYPNHDRAFDLWQEGIKQKVFMPQFHGREHLNFQKWMRLLGNRDKSAVDCFELGCYAMIDGSCVLEAYDISKQEDYPLLTKSIEEGLDLFEQIFGFKSKSMIAPCYTWDDVIEDAAYRKGVKYIQGGYIQNNSRFCKSQGQKFQGHYFGETNRNGQRYLVRNCGFEPSINPVLNADYCLGRIDKAFKMHLPAVISCHRLNFIGNLVPENRDRNLKDFQFLLRKIVDKYPDVEFLSSDEVFE